MQLAVPRDVMSMALMKDTSKGFRCVVRLVDDAIEEPHHIKRVRNVCLASNTIAACVASSMWGGMSAATGHCSLRWIS